MRLVEPGLNKRLRDFAGGRIPRVGIFHSRRSRTLWAAMYVLVLVNFRVKYEFIGGYQKGAFFEGIWALGLPCFMWDVKGDNGWGLRVVVCSGRVVSCEASRRVVEVLERLPPRALRKWIVCCYLTDDPGRDVCGVMAHYAKKVGASEDLFAKIRDQLAASSKGEGSSKAPALAGPVVETVRPAAKRAAVSKLKGVEKDRKRLRALTKTGGVALVDLTTRTWAYTSRGLVLGRRLSAMMQEEIAVGDKKKLADELATLRVQVERDQRNWDEEKKKLEAKVKKLKAMYTEHVKGFEKALRQAEFLYKEVSVTDCRFNVNLDIYDNKMLDVAEISKLKALAEGVEVARDEEETLVTTPMNVGDDRVSNEEDVEGEAEGEAADGENDVVEE
ncbi:hypothetical protein DEO72_LG7g1622 [Vigna unguiculata]|uniref:Uncharacterized protein n=1 Tax=Vigna unguiculata TaxID=3917 RepID=A0A4D6MIE3_VIGUN|nr:hypothetical protein DEO72_LG7g1622 [Vigna unguiculata]